MSKVISIMNQKGGVGKTATTSALGYGLSQRGYKVLLIDLDPQANLTQHFGVDSNQVKNPVTSLIYDVIRDNVIDYQKYVNEIDSNLFLIPSQLTLAYAETDMTVFFNKAYIVSTFVDDLRDIFDYILIDCPPNLGINATNALAASDSVIIPTQAEGFSMQGIEHLITTINNIKRFNKELSVEGILITQFQNNTLVGNHIKDDIKEKYGEEYKIFETVIPRSVEERKAAYMGMPVQKFNKSCTISVAYEKIIDEVIANG